MTANWPRPDDGIIAGIPFPSDRTGGKTWQAIFHSRGPLVGLSKVELVRQALQELGEASAPELATFIEQRHGVRIEARFIPVLRASLLGQEMLERARQAARAATQTAAKPGADGEMERGAETIPACARQSRP